jgi:hypothetical protein
MVDLSPSLGLELCKLHKELKAIENERPLGVSHGKGVTAKSRRILVNTICRIVHMDSGPGQQEASEVLHDLFYSLIVSTAELSNPGDVERMYRITENVLDLSAFSPSLISEIFDDIDSEHRTARDQFLSGVVTMCRYGYSFAVHDDDVVIQVCLLKRMTFASVLSYLTFFVISFSGIVSEELLFRYFELPPVGYQAKHLTRLCCSIDASVKLSFPSVNWEPCRQAQSLMNL